ncbi:MAG: DUF3899 domain-containing protein [Treponema sp.]|nr:DUF3899 domain-containing protein [Treponema sp.]
MIKSKKMIAIFKRYFAKKDLKNFLIGAGIAVFYTVLHRGPYFIFNLVNFLFIIGLYHLVLGLCVIIGNSGLFKIFTYQNYKRKFRLSARDNPTIRPMDLGEYTKELHKNRRSVKNYFIVGLPFFLLSYLIAIIGSRL